jgi:hypothetical protein
VNDHKQKLDRLTNWTPEKEAEFREWLAKNGKLGALAARPPQPQVARDLETLRRLAPVDEREFAKWQAEQRTNGVTALGAGLRVVARGLATLTPDHLPGHGGTP